MEGTWCKPFMASERLKPAAGFAKPLVFDCGPENLFGAMAKVELRNL